MSSKLKNVSVPSHSGVTARCPLSVVILTYNEAGNIARCLRHLEWADEVIVVDSFSDDSTLDISLKERSDVRTFSHAFRDFGDQRNWALSNAAPRNDWVLFIDADEICNREVTEAIQQAVRTPGEFVGFYLTCRNYFLGRWIRRCTLYPSWQVRLLKVGEVLYRKEGHGQREVTDGRLGYITAPYDHYGFSKGIEHWIARHNVYSSNECELIHRLRTEPLQIMEVFSRDPVVRRRCLKRLAARLPGRPVNRFLYLYFVRLGIFDGYEGLVFCLLRLAHELHITAKQAERRYVDDLPK